MTVLVYKNTKTTIPAWVSTIHVQNPRGVAYETPTHFVHLYGHGEGLWILSTGLVATEKKVGSLRDWVERVFGAEDVKSSVRPEGLTVRGVWRPGLYYFEETAQGLGISEQEQRSAEQALRLLVERFDELLLYIEPDAHGLKAYSHKTRELLILACTELENTWKHYMRIAGVTSLGNQFNTNDYVKLLGPLFLAEYEIRLRPYSSLPTLTPFSTWNPSAPTQSLAWYDAYNKTKHDRDQHFDKATLENCIAAVAANVVMFAVRFGPVTLYESRGTLATLVNHLFGIELRNCAPETFYTPLLAVPSGTRDDLICGGRKDWVQPWAIQPLVL
ncbi:hypothetical protein ACFQAT_28930 [Undibacterium arcticum]|uniref:Uncharacterized protein n=1 Tax=Undibacterium arcticum TaxID=1762892 RepID=A0ABV7F5W5_9BURK